MNLQSDCDKSKSGLLAARLTSVTALHIVYVIDPSLAHSCFDTSGLL